MQSNEPTTSERKTLNERFTDFADHISELMGRWWVSVVSAILIIVWTLYCLFTQGSGWWYGQFYNFPLNLVTTIAELFIGFLLAAATNRVERRHEQLLREIKTHTQVDLFTTREDVKATHDAEVAVWQAEKDIRLIKADIAIIKEAVIDN